MAGAEHWFRGNAQLLTLGWPLVGSKDLQERKKRTGSWHRENKNSQSVVGTGKPQKALFVHHDQVPQGQCPLTVSEADLLGLSKAGLWWSGLRRLAQSSTENSWPHTRETLWGQSHSPFGMRQSSRSPFQECLSQSKQQNDKILVEAVSHRLDGKF